MVDHNTESATLAGGCFWCLEPVDQQVKGVAQVVSGYSGGHVVQPSYEQVCSETTGHAEAVQVIFDPQIIPYAGILDIFFAIHDPTTLNRQGADSGTSYRSIILYANESQRQQAETFIQKLDNSGSAGSPIVTEVAKLERFYEAEEEHKQFYMNNPAAMYCQIVISPKIAKFRGAFAENLETSDS